MNDDELCFTPATELAALIRARRLSPVEAVQAVLARIERVGSPVNAFVTILPEQALAAAHRAEQQIMELPADELGALHGVPVTVKDLTDTAGVRTTYGSVHYKDHVPDRDGIGWARLKAAGAVLIGKTTTPEFGMGAVTDSPLTGVTNNPWDLTRTVGGSSGGAGAAVAAGLGPIAWGSDGGGSIRVPASCCGTVGLKASLGRIPVTGEWDVYGTVDISGPLTRTVADAALALQVTAGHDQDDPLSLPASTVDFTRCLDSASVRGLRVAYSPDLGHGPVDPEVRTIVEAAAHTFATTLGALVEEVTVDLPDPIQYFSDFWSPQALAALEDMVVGQGFDPELSNPIFAEFAQRGHRMSAVDYYRVAVLTRARIAAGFAAVFRDHDLLLTPTMPVAAFPHPGPEGGPVEIDGHPVREPVYDFHRFTEPPSHAGLPAITLPCGFTSDGLPVGLQIIGPHHADDAVLRAAAVYEQATEWHTRRPPLGAVAPGHSSRAL
ncbi:amidase [Streptomyces sp. NBC_00459]|uniref:amidase n=1 Tax=Streptomyces sp. NBC_00459 TaxID=2975749 RepID=UPI002E19687A